VITGEDVMEVTALLLLGAYHGLNPGMGWLFAVALGMQAGNARGVWRALRPLSSDTPWPLARLSPRPHSRRC
jgi:hypothetical protein